MAGDSVSIKFGADASGFRAGANEAKEHVDSLIDSLKDFKREQVQQARTARFFASEIAEIIPAADGAKGSIQGLINVALAGGGMAMAFEGALFILKEIKSETEAQEKVLKQIEEDYTKAGEEGRKAYEKIRQGLLGLSPAQLQWAKDVEDTHVRIGKIRKAIEDLREGGGSALMKVGEAFKMLTGADVGPLKTVDEAISDLLDKEAQEIRQLADLKKARDEAQADLDEDAASRAALTKEINDNSEALKIYQMNLKADDALEKEIFDRTLKQLNEQKQLEQDLSKAAESARQSSLDAWKKMQHGVDEVRHAITVAEEADNRKRLEVLKQTVAQFGAAIGGVFKSLIRGSTDLGTALKDMLLGFVDAAIDALIKLGVQAVLNAIIGKKAAALEGIGSTAAHTAGAIAGAAESQAFIPFAGPGLAIAAAAEVQGALAAMTGPLLAVASAAGGMMVPSDMLAMVHEDERVLPAKYSEGLDRMVLNGGGGDHYTFQFNAPIDRVWWEQNEGHIVRTLANATRRGRRA